MAHEGNANKWLLTPCLCVLMATTITIPSFALNAIPSQYTFESQFIIRFPHSIVGAVRTEVVESGCPGDLCITFSNDRIAKVSFEGKTYPAVLLDLPTIIESHRMLDDGSQYVKIADIHQVLCVYESTANDIFKVDVENYRRMHWLCADGLTPPMRNVCVRRFGKKLGSGVDRGMSVEEIEQHVQKLLQKDSDCVSSSYTLYDSSGKMITSSSGMQQHSGSIIELNEPELESEPPISEEESGSEEVVEEDYDALAAEIEDNLMQDLDTSVVIKPSTQDTMADMETSDIILQLQQKLQSKREQLASVTNPLIRARLEDVIKQLDADLSRQKLGSNI